jgi:hypothetical protein
LREKFATRFKWVSHILSTGEGVDERGLVQVKTIAFNINITPQKQG